MTAAGHPTSVDSAQLVDQLLVLRSVLDTMKDCPGSEAVGPLHPAATLLDNLWELIQQLGSMMVADDDVMKALQRLCRYVTVMEHSLLL